MKLQTYKNIAHPTEKAKCSKLPTDSKSGI